jgi:hypothetical protein
MKWQPMLVSLRFRSGAHANHGFGLWIPLFILGPIALIILLVLFLIALPFLLLSLLFTWDLGWWKWLAFGVPTVFSTMHELKGLEVDVAEGKRKIYLAVH